jgi:biotin transporter BioY
MSPEAQSWLDDLWEYVRLLIAPIIVYGILWLMKLIRMDERFIAVLQFLDESATVLIIALFLASNVRRAFTKALAGGKKKDG